MVSQSDLFENNYICTIDIPIDRISPKRKTYINFQYTLKQVETIPFYEITKEHHLFIDSVLEQFKEILISYYGLYGKEPKTLEEIGYNPFVSCTNIEFVSNSENYIVYKNALYTKNMLKLDAFFEVLWYNIKKEKM